MVMQKIRKEKWVAFLAKRSKAHVVSKAFNVTQRRKMLFDAKVWIKDSYFGHFECREYTAFWAYVSIEFLKASVTIWL